MSDSLTQDDNSPVSWRDYVELTKPVVVALMILTSVIGMFLSVPGMVPWEILIFGNLGIALCAGSAAAVNHLVDQRIDLIMARTKKSSDCARSPRYPRCYNFCFSPWYCRHRGLANMD
jgi:protoheme IX farnesyltransferase